MTGRLARRAGAAGALTALVLALAPAMPAGADPTLTIDAPSDGKVFDTETITISGKADADLLFSMKQIDLSIGDTASQTVTCSDTPCSFSWSPTIRTNGKYTVQVTAIERSVAGVLERPSQASRSFSVSAPPRAPVLDPPKVNEDRSVSLSWTRNTEPDMLYYAVFRSDPGSTRYVQVGKNVTQPSSGSKVTFTDTTTTFDGGDYTYSVVAVRSGVSGELKTPSKQMTASVPPPPTTTTAPGAPGAAGSSQPGATTSTVKPGTAAGVDLGKFLAGQPAPLKLTPPTAPEPPDTGFNQTLPFGARPPGDDREPGEDQAQPANDHKISVISQLRGGRPLVPVAAGLILLLLAVHARLLNNRVKAAGDGPVDLAVGSGTAGAATAGVTVLQAGGAEPAPEPDAAPEPALDAPGPQAEAEPAVEDVVEPEPVVDPELGIEPEVDPDAAWAPPPAAGRNGRNGLAVDPGDDVDASDDGDDLDDGDEDDPVPVVVSAGAGRPDWGWDEIEVREVVSPARR